MQKIPTEAKEDKITVTKSPGDAAKEILRNSFCIYKADSSASELIRQARCQALKILDDPSPPLTWCKRIIHGSLYGYHVPSAAKRLFRAFPASELQPWPNESFQIASQKVAASLHEILMTVMDKIAQHKLQRAPLTSSSYSSKDQRSRKRARVSENIFQNHQVAANTIADFSTKSSWNIPKTATDAVNCPLDYFLYHNKNPLAVNCSEHVDRGILICVCLSSAAPGLEVKPRGRSNFICPEAALIHNANLYQEKEPVSGLLCIMAGDHLSQFVDGEPIACVHRVRNQLKRARLSISYELRIQHRSMQSF
jgi:hypothetical protein